MLTRMTSEDFHRQLIVVLTAEQRKNKTLQDDVVNVNYIDLREPPDLLVQILTMKIIRIGQTLYKFQFNLKSQPLLLFRFSRYCKYIFVLLVNALSNYF